MKAPYLLMRLGGRGVVITLQQLSYKWDDQGKQGLESYPRSSVEEANES